MFSNLVYYFNLLKAVLIRKDLIGYGTSIVFLKATTLSSFIALGYNLIIYNSF